MKRFLIGSLLAVSLSARAQQFVVTNLESRVPIRDVLVYTDDNQQTKSNWDGTFSLKEGFCRINFSHPQYLDRYVLKSELKGDTICLLPSMHTLDEVVIYGHRRFDERMSDMFRPSPQQKLDAQLQQAIPDGFNPIAFGLWLYEKTLAKKVERRSQRKKALREVRRKEAELQEKWDTLGLGTRTQE